MRTQCNFQKVSYQQYKKDFINLCEYLSKDVDINNDYEDIQKPRRSTSGSAGYDFYIPFDIELIPKRTYKIPTGIRFFIEEGYRLDLIPRSSLGCNFGFRLLNTIGLIDSDYYYAKNEGHILIAFEVDKTVKLKKGDRFCQGILQKYYITLNDDINKKRTGGFGSTN